MDGTQYAGRVPFLTTDDGAPPMFERAPCVVYGIHNTAIGTLVDFMLGEGRYPQVSCGSSEDDEDLDEEWGLNEDDSALLEKWVNGPLTKSARLKAQIPEALTMAMSAGSVAVVATLRQGMPRLEALPAKWCSPTFDPRTGDVVKLDIRYPYVIEEQDPYDPLIWTEKCKIYRRVIDQVCDTVYLPGEGREDGREPAWSVDYSQTQPHGLGYCPVRWYAFERGAPTAAHFDGKPLHVALHDEVDALNFSLSQRYRAAIYSGDPQLWETGVDEMATVAPMGRPSGHAEIELQASGPGGKPVGIFTSSPKRWGRGGARKKGPGVVWRYPDATSKVGMLSLPGDALDGIGLTADDLRKKIAEDLSVVLIDPADAKTFGALSGKAMAFMFTRQIARADRIRQDAGDNLFLACVDLLLRMCLSVTRLQPGGVRIPGMTKVQKILEACEKDTVGPVTPATAEQPATASTVKAWFGPRLELEWGPYFTNSAEEENFIVTMCLAAFTGGIMPLEIVLEKLRSVFSFSSTEELMKKLEEAKLKAQEHAANEAEGQAKVGAKYAQGQPDGPPWPPEKGSASGAKGDKKA